MPEVAGDYLGGELELFAHAHGWKRYWQSKLGPYVRGQVLEVGAGMGANTQFFMHRAQSLTLCEPDPSLAKELTRRYGESGGTRVFNAPLSGIDARFDAIFYIDVLEHIENDRSELAMAYERLNPSGCVVVLAPAYPFLYSPFDKQVGHFRRYTRHSLCNLAPEGSHVKEAFYLDSVGCAASLANRMALRQSLPTLKQIRFWDRVLVPISRICDPLLCYGVGKTVVAIFQKLGGESC